MKVTHFDNVGNLIPDISKVVLPQLQTKVLIRVFTEYAKKLGKKEGEINEPRT